MHITLLLKKPGTIILTLILLFSVSIKAQTADADSAYKYSTSTVVVTGRGYENRLAKSTVAISVVNKYELEALPFAKFSDLVKILPGFFLFNKDGLGRDPVVGARGFYGAGEAEYVQVIQDGIPLNDIETGLVNWNLVDYENIDKIEVLRGGASALYGENAVGGVMNIFTNSKTNLNSLSFGTGNFGAVNFGAKSSGKLFNNFYSVNASYNKTDGFRDHSNWKEFSIGTKYKINLNDASLVNFSLDFSNIDSDDPGPLSERELNQNRKSSSPFYKSDGKDEQRLYLRSRFTHKDDNSEFNTYVNFTRYDYKQVRTFVNAVPIIDPTNFSITGFFKDELYGDSNEREFVNNQVAAGIKYFSVFKNIPFKFYSGLEVNYADYSSKFYNMFNGFESEYMLVSPNRLELTNDAEGRRTKLAFYVSADYALTSFIKIDAGIRYDNIDDKYESALPDSLIEIDNAEFSPKVGININYLSEHGFNGNFYFNYNRSFKSPTIDQLTDISQTDFGVYFPTSGGLFFNPVKGAPFANTNLKPQKSTSFEIGFYQQFKFSQNILSELMFSLYTIDINDEIDFDISSLSYQNIIESNHSGIESSLKTYLPKGWLYFLNYTFNKVEFTSGNFDGNKLKGIPETVFSTGIVKKDLHSFDFSVVYNLTGSIFLDDENTTKLPNFFTIDAAVSYKISKFRFSLKANNLLNKKFSSTGFLLNGVKFLYPSAGTVIIGSFNFVL